MQFQNIYERKKKEYQISSGPKKKQKKKHEKQKKHDLPSTMLSSLFGKVD